MTRTPRLLLSASVVLWALPALAGPQSSPVCDLAGTRSASALDRGDASFRAKRAFVWDGDTLVAETGLADDKGVIWRTQYVPGPGGGVRLGTTVPLTLESADTGLRIERWEAGTSAWVAVDRAGWVVALAAASEDDAELGVMPKEGFRKGDRYRLTVTSGLEDAFGRGMQLPSGTPSSGVALVLDIPASGDLPEAGATYNLTFDTVYAASSTLGQRFPGGLTSLYGGAWTDPVTGLVLDGGQWYDPRNATYLDEDPGADPIGSLYAFASGAPHMSGAFTLGIPASPDWSWAEGMSGAPWDPDIMGNAVPGYRAAARALANTRVQGGLMVAGGVMEAGVAPMTGAAAPFVALHAADVASAGLVQMLTGEATSTYTHRIIAAGARAAGASSGTAEQIGAWGDFAVGMVGPAIAIRAEMAATRLPVVLERGGLGWGEAGGRLWRPPFDNEVPSGLKGIGKREVAPKSAGALAKAELPEGIGSFRDVGGHHIHAKKAFEGAVTPGGLTTRQIQGEMLAISNETLEQMGIRHLTPSPTITGTQQRLFNELASDVAAGLRRNTMFEHNRIAVQALVEGGMNRAVARTLVARSAWRLRRMGIRFPVGIPWN